MLVKISSLVRETIKTHVVNTITLKSAMHILCYVFYVLMNIVIHKLSI